MMNKKTPFAPLLIYIILDLKRGYGQNINSHSHSLRLKPAASGSGIVWLPGNCRRGVVARAMWEEGGGGGGCAALISSSLWVLNLRTGDRQGDSKLDPIFNSIQMSFIWHEKTYVDTCHCHGKYQNTIKRVVKRGVCESESAQMDPNGPVKVHLCALRAQLTVIALV